MYTYIPENFDLFLMQRILTSSIKECVPYMYVEMQLVIVH